MYVVFVAINTPPGSGTLLTERVEELQIKLEQAEYCIRTLHPTSGAENTEVLSLDCPAIMAYREVRPQYTEISDSTESYSLIPMNNSNCFLLMQLQRVYLFLPAFKGKHEVMHIE